jgi:hypothetical protein
MLTGQLAVLLATSKCFWCNGIMKSEQCKPSGFNAERMQGFLCAGRLPIAIGIAAVSAVALDGWLGRRQWPSTATRLVGSSEATEAMLTFSGLGSLDGASQARNIKQVFHLPGAHWEYSSDTFSIGALSQQLSRSMPHLRHVGVNGHSMGGPTGLETVRRALPDATFGPIVLHCSPFAFTDGRNHRLARAVSDVVRIPTGPATKIAFSLIRSAAEGVLPWDAWAEAVTNARSGCSPRVWLEQLRELQTVDLSSHRDGYARMVGEETKVWYCRPADPDMDRTVDTTQASERYGEFFEGLGVPYTIVNVPEAGHADVARACTQLALLAG